MSFLERGHTMSQEIEIEFKSLLTEKDYKKLCATFELSDANSFTQTNYYFDTPQGDLKEKRLGLRIRTFDDKAELTLKSPLENQEGLLETTDYLTHEEAKALLNENNILVTGQVAKKLQEFNINANDVYLIGELKTKRLEYKLDESHLLVLDESWYHGKHDYELEMEVKEAVSGKDYFVKFIKEYGITYIPTENKISRTIRAKKAL